MQKYFIPIYILLFIITIGVFLGSMYGRKILIKGWNIMLSLVRISWTGILLLVMSGGIWFLTTRIIDFAEKFKHFEYYIAIALSLFFLVLPIQIGKKALRRNGITEQKAQEIKWNIKMTMTIASLLFIFFLIALIIEITQI